MQQAIYNSIMIQATTASIKPTSKTLFLRRFAQQWDLIGVVTLITSSAAYGVFALLNLA